MHLGKKKAFIFIAIACVCAGIFFAGRSNNSVKVSYDPNDGSSKTTTKTVYSKQGQTVQDLLKSNGYSIDKDLYDYSVSLARQASKIHNIKIVKKANGVITIGDKKVKYSSTQKTIAGLLKEKNIKINKDDIVTPGTSTLLTSKVKNINVVRVTKAQVASTEEVPYQTEVVADSNVSQGSSKVEQSGQNGQKTVVSEAVYHNGVLVSEKVKSSSVTAKPVTMKVSMNPSDIAVNTSSKDSTSSDTSNTSSSTSSKDSSTSSDVPEKSNSSSTDTDPSKTSDTTETKEDTKPAEKTTSQDTNQKSESNTSTADSSNTSNDKSSSSSVENTSTTTDSGNATNSKSATNTATNTSSTESSDSGTTTKTSTSTVVIPYQTYNVYVSNLAKGTTQTTTQGVNGEKTVTTEMTYKDGKLVSQKETSSTITKQPVTQVVAVGTKEETATTQSNDSNQSASTTATSTTSTTSTSSSSTSSTQSNLSQYVSQTKNVTYNHKTENVSATDFDFLCAVVSQEDNSGYEGALAVISCIMNRADSGKWGGTTAVAVVKANGQFSAYSSGAYKKYLNGKSSAAVQAAVKDCVYGGVRNHSYYSFQATKKANSVKIGGNYYE